MNLFFFEHQGNNLLRAKEVVILDTGYHLTSHPTNLTSRYTLCIEFVTNKVIKWAHLVTCFVKSTSPTPFIWHSSNLAQMLWTHWRCAYDFFFSKNLNVLELKSFFKHVLSRRHLLCIINSSYTFILTFFKLCTIVMDTLKMCMWFSGRLHILFTKIYM
jgi:hypothetical protein